VFAEGQTSPGVAFTGTQSSVANAGCAVKLRRASAHAAPRANVALFLFIRSFLLGSLIWVFPQSTVDDYRDGKSLTAQAVWFLALRISGSRSELGLSRIGAKGIGQNHLNNHRGNSWLQQPNLLRSFVGCG
jgi:hypothetical protein